MLLALSQRHGHAVLLLVLQDCAQDAVHQVDIIGCCIVICCLICGMQRMLTLLRDGTMAGAAAATGQALRHTSS